MIRGGACDPIEAPADILVGAILHQCFERVSGPREAAPPNLIVAAAFPKRHGCAQHGERIFGQIGVNRFSERRRIVRQDAVAANDGPRLAASLQPTPDTVSGRLRQEGCQFVNRLQGRVLPRRTAE
jgi:hypothetical protein